MFMSCVVTCTGLYFHSDANWIAFTSALTNHCLLLGVFYRSFASVWLGTGLILLSHGQFDFFIICAMHNGNIKVYDRSSHCLRIKWAPQLLSCLRGVTSFIPHQTLSFHQKQWLKYSLLHFQKTKMASRRKCVLSLSISLFHLSSATKCLYNKKKKNTPK